MTGVKHILVIRFSAMGDVAMVVPVLRAALDQNQGVKFTVLTKPSFKPLFNSIPGVEVITADLKGEHKGILGLYKLANQLKDQQFNEVADLHNVLRTKILKLFLRTYPFFQLDKGRAEKKALTSGSVFKPLKSTHQRYADVFIGMGLKVDLNDPIYPNRINVDLSNKFSEYKEELPLIGIAPFAAHQGKMYPLDQMERVISELSKEYQIFLFGGGQEEELALARIERQNNNVISLAGKLSLEEELKIISNLDLMISMDSGNGHLASIFGVKTISIWGVTHPYAGFKPFNQPEDFSLLADRSNYPLIPTSIYGNKHPKAYLKAAGSISEKVVIDKVKSII